MSSSVDQIATVVLYSNDSYAKCVAIEEPGYVMTSSFRLLFEISGQVLDVRGNALRREVHLSTRQVYLPLQDRERTRPVHEDRCST